MWSLPFSGCIGHRSAFGAKFEAFPERSKYLRAAAANVLGGEERKSKVFLNARVFLGFQIHRQLANSQGLLQHSAHITHAEDLYDRHGDTEQTDCGNRWG